VKTVISTSEVVRGERWWHKTYYVLVPRALVNGCQTGIYYIDTILPFLLPVMQFLIIMTIFDIEGITEKKEGGQEGEQPWREI
jgi:hypothetical protein